MDSTLDVAKDMTDAWVAPDLAKDAVDALGEIGLDSGACPVGQVRYESPGCGVEVKPVCGSSEQDACFRPVCSCQGKTISRCDYATEPFLSFGACPASDSGIDLPPDGVAVDLAVDLPVDIAQDVGLDGSVDGVLDSSVDVAYDAGPCPSGQVLRYESPGCDAEAKPVCGSRSQDACYRAVCSCKGVTISRCDYASEPFAAFGACSGTDGGPG